MEFDIDFTSGPYAGMSTPRTRYPDMYDYEDARSVMWSLPESEILLGLDGTGEPVTADLTDDSPHILISAASGAGKSVTARSIATQALIKGYTVVFLDAKRHSHRWAKNLPGVLYASSIADIATALVSVGAEMHRRNEVVEGWPGSIESAPVGPPILVVFEEMNATMDALKDADKKIGRDEVTATSSFEEIMFLGRAARCHVVAIGQRVDATVMKVAVRENFGVRILIRHSWETWSLLVPKTSSRGGQPAAPQEAGRGHVVYGGRPLQTQLMYLSEETAAALVRDAHDARERAGLIEPPLSRREDRKRARAAVAATQRATGRMMPYRQ